MDMIADSLNPFKFIVRQWAKLQGFESSDASLLCSWVLTYRDILPTATYRQRGIGAE